MLKDAICATAVTALFALMVPAQADEMQRSKVDVRQDAKAVSADWAGYAGYFADQDGSVTLARDNADWRSYSGYFADSYKVSWKDAPTSRKEIKANWTRYAGYFADQDGRVALAKDNADWRSYSGYFANSYGPLSRDVQVKRKDISADWRSYAGYFADSAGRADLAKYSAAWRSYAGYFSDAANLTKAGAQKDLRADRMDLRDERHGG